MTTETLFPTLIDRAPLGDDALVAELEHSVRSLARDDDAGRRRVERLEQGGLEGEEHDAVAGGALGEDHHRTLGQRLADARGLMRYRAAVGAVDEDRAVDAA